MIDLPSPKLTAKALEFQWLEDGNSRLGLEGLFLGGELAVGFM